MYLPAAAQELLFDRIQGLTASGSRVGIEALSPNFADPDATAQRRERIGPRPGVDGQGGPATGGPANRGAVVFRGT